MMVSAGVASVMIYGATEAAAATVTALVQANPGLYGQGSEDGFVSREVRVRAGLALLTEHGFRLPHLHDPHPRIEVPGEIGEPQGFAYERALIPETLRFSGDTLRHYRPDDPRDWRQFRAARTAADALGYQFYRAEAPFGAALFIVDGYAENPGLSDRLLFGKGELVRLYNPYEGLDEAGRAHESVTLSARKYMDRNPEFAMFAGFTSGWRSKPQFLWTRWEGLQAWSDVRGFRVDGEGGWRLDSEFGMQVLVSDHRTAIVSLIHPDTDRRTFLRFHEAEGQVDLNVIPDGFKLEPRGMEGLSAPAARRLRFFTERGYILDPEDTIVVEPSMRFRMAHGFGPDADLPIKRKVF